MEFDLRNMYVECMELYFVSNCTELGHSTTDCTSLATYKLIWNLIVAKKTNWEVVQNTLFCTLVCAITGYVGQFWKTRSNHVVYIAIQEEASFANIHEDIVNQSIINKDRPCTCMNNALPSSMILLLRDTYITAAFFILWDTLVKMSIRYMIYH